MAEREFEGEAVALALQNSATAAAVAEALIGCAWYRDDPDDLARITAADSPTGPFQLQAARGPRALTLAELARGYIVDTRDSSPLAPLLEAAMPAHIKAADEARRMLAKRGISHPKLTHDDAVKLADLLSAEEEHFIPPWELRREIADRFDRYDLHRPYIELAKGWIRVADTLNKPWPWDALIQMVSAYRALRDYENALTCTEVAIERGSGERIPPGQLSILCNQRAATCLDLYERSRNVELLKDGRACANRSWAIEPSEACSNVYERLKRFENEQMDEQAAAARRAEEEQRKRYERQRGWRARKPPRYL
jgi:hypothetical protein